MNIICKYNIHLHVIVIRGKTGIIFSKYQTPLGARPGLGTQPRSKAPSNLRGKIVETAVIDIGLVRLSTREWPKVGRRTAKQ